MSFKDLVIATGTGTLAGGTLTYLNPSITPSTVVLTNVAALAQTTAGLHLAAVSTAGQVVFTSIDAAGAIVGGDDYTFTFIALQNNLCLASSG
jgi:hypothetical protein